jgi:hypothetical protein
MPGKPVDQPGKPWRLWTALVACGLAVIVSGLLAIADGLAAVMASWDNPSPGIGWIHLAIVGHCVLAGAGAVLFGLALRPSSRHRSEAIAGWTIIRRGLPGSC